MPEPSSFDAADLRLEQVRRQLNDAAAFGKHLPPEQLENAAEKIAEAQRIYAEHRRNQT